MKFARLFLRQLFRTEGYTLDQTILIVAIIAILVTLIIITVGWNLLNRAGGTKLAVQFRQIEDVNGQFYNEFRRWPDNAFSTAPTTPKDGNVVVLSSLTPAGATLASTITLTRNYLSGFKATTASVQHSFSSGGLVEQQTITNPSGMTGKFLMVQFTKVPFAQVQAAEWAIDGQVNENYTTGRVTAYKDTSGDCMVATLSAANAATTSTGSGSLVNACYAANNVQ